MANHKSAEKRNRQNKVRNERNTARRSAVRTVIKKLTAAVDNGEKETASSLLVAAQEKLARLAKNGVIKRNTAARKTSRLASKINSL